MALFYSVGHVRALEAQVERLERQRAEDIARLERQLADATNERRELLDRLLEKRNVEPLKEKPQVVAPVQVIQPFGSAATPEMIDALKESWINEEATYIATQNGISIEQAREAAERRYLEEHKAQ